MPLTLVKKYPQAAVAVHESFYVDNGLTGGDTLQEGMELQRQLQELFAQGGFVFHKWKTSAPAALKHVSSHLLNEQSMEGMRVTPGNSYDVVQVRIAIAKPNL